MRKNPNLVFIFTDEQRWDTLGAYGNTGIRTPNLDALAGRSALFRRAYVTQPVCTPSRASILTGLYPHNHGCIANNVPLVASIPTLPELLDDQSHATAYIGKWHLGDEIVGQHGFDRWTSTVDHYRAYYTKQEYRDRHCDYFAFLRERGFVPDVDDGTYQYFSRDFTNRLPEQFTQARFLASEASDFIVRNRNEPFILYLNYYDPHFPCCSAYDDRYDPSAVDLPANFGRVPGDDVPLKLKYKHLHAKEIGTVWSPYRMTGESLWRRMIARYWGMISLVDSSVGSVLDTLRANGLDDDTIVVFTSDHGDMMGDFGMLGKCVLYESVSRVPLMIRVPGITDSGREIRTPASQVDLVPTLMDFMGRTPNRAVDGKSLRKHIENGTDPDDDVFIEWNGSDGEATWMQPYRSGPGKDRIDRVIGAASRTILTPRGLKLTISAAGEHELYDLHADPHERHNVFRDRRGDPVVRELADRIADWQARTGDRCRIDL